MELDRFNFDTMSGVYPGTRTQVFQRVLLRRTLPAEPLSPGEPLSSGESQSPVEALPPDEAQQVWALIYWYEDPAACVLRIDGTETPLRIETPQASNRTELLNLALAQLGWQPFVCGNCHHWQAGAGVSVDGLPLGKCSLTRTQETLEIPLLLSAQSSLALGCPHWMREQSVGGSTEPQPKHPQPDQPLSDQPLSDQPLSDQPQPDHLLPMHPLPKIAEISESKMKPLRRWQVRVRRWLSPPPAAPTLHDHLVERSGVGAGTEPCPCCQGRIANLGALAVQDEATDKQTLSVWRCRVCHALFLSDWVDRWERVDSLETEETIYRIAPVEAAEILTLIASVQEAEHPRRRGERSAQREWVLAQVAGRAPVSHIIKQGR